MKKALLFTVGLLLLLATEILRVYFIMPFPGSQQSNTISIAYFLHRNILWLRILGLILTLPPLYYFLSRSKTWIKVLVLLPVLFYAFVFYMFNYRFLADKMFYPPTNKWLTRASISKIDTNQLVIGSVINGEAKAYPVQIIGYHHQVADTIGGEPVLVTYCTVCRTGRVFSPVINGHYQKFRLVGMDHFNAMFEDPDTKSWWRQVNGEAIAGPLKGSQLQELPSIQIRLGTWIRNHPETMIMQPDTLFNKQYADLKGYDSGTIKGSLERRDSASWKFKSWVVGVVQNGHSKAYDWNELVQKKVINDTIADMPIVLVLDIDGSSFHVWKRIVNNKPTHFEWNAEHQLLKDDITQSGWSTDGICVDGSLRGIQLQPVQAYQEFWHSWRTFHPMTTKLE